MTHSIHGEQHGAGIRQICVQIQYSYEASSITLKM